MDTSGTPDNGPPTPIAAETSAATPEDGVSRVPQELDGAGADTAHAKRVRLRKVRGVTAVILAVLTAVSVVASTVAFWAHRTVFDEDHYLELVVPLAAEPTVTSALSDYLSAQIVTALDLEARIANVLSSIPQLPEQAALLADPLADAGADLVHKRVTIFLESQRFRDLWERVNTVGHQKLVALLEGDYGQLPNVTAGDEVVTLNLIPIISTILRDLVRSGVGRVAPNLNIPEISASDIPDVARGRLAQALGVSLPPDFGQITIMERSQLEQLQGAVDGVHRLVWLLIAVSVLLAAATVIVSVRRRRALVQVAVAIAVGLLIATVVLRRLKEAVLDKIESDQAQGAARTIVASTGETLRHVGMVVLITAIVVGIVAYLAGRPKWLMTVIAWTRTTIAGPDSRLWVGRHADAVRIGVAGVALLALFVAGISVLSILVIGGLAGLALWLVERARLALPATVSTPDDEDLVEAASPGKTAG